MKPYNGHRSWNAWNVALWISSEEWQYRLAMACLQRAKTIGAAARLFLKESGLTRTPDGANYNITCVREALSGLAE